MLAAASVFAERIPEAGEVAAVGDGEVRRQGAIGAVVDTQLDTVDRPQLTGGMELENFELERLRGRNGHDQRSEKSDCRNCDNQTTEKDSLARK